MGDDRTQRQIFNTKAAAGDNACGIVTLKQCAFVDII